MSEIMSRVEVENFNTWLAVHSSNSQNRRLYSIIDGPIYRDIDNPNAVLFHIHVGDLDQAIQWFRSEQFKDAAKRSTAIRREFYLVERQQAP